MRDFTVWEPPIGSDADSCPAYVVVVGNTGAGKSTVVARLASDLFQDRSVIGIDERTTHHPFLDRLFFEPHSFAFELQLNFMLQRVLIVKRWLQAGISVVMERSHLDDPIFIEHLLAFGLVDAAEYDVYQALWRVLAQRMPLPDAIVALEVPASTSLQRLTADEASGKRPREFVSEAHKERWLRAWGELYSARIAQLRRDKALESRLGIFTNETEYETIKAFVASRLNCRRD
ncbi:MAG: deoxynucleoside kinase [Frankiaceae bacterium]